MSYYYEIFFDKPYITPDIWDKTIEQISKYNGMLRSFKIIITNNCNNINYYLKTKCLLPPKIYGVNSLMFKPCKEININNVSKSKILITNKNMIYLLTKCNVNNKKIKNIEIKVINIFYIRIITRIYIYTSNNCRYLILGNNYANFLSTNYEINNNYLYKKTPKYIDISKILHLLTEESKMSLFKVDSFPYLIGQYFLNQFNYDFDRHSIIFGSSGCGKSKFISLFINNIYNNKNILDNFHIVVIDPHASLINEIGEFSRIIDFKNDGINIFPSYNELNTIVEMQMDLFKNIISSNYNSKMERVLRNSLYLLHTSRKFNFQNLRKCITEIEYYTNLINSNKDLLPQSTIDFFQTEYSELKTKDYMQAVAPIISFVDEMEVTDIFKKDCNVYLKDVVNDNEVTLISLDRMYLGEKVLKLLAGLIMEDIFILKQGKQIDKNLIFIIDEAPLIETNIMSRFLSESRKYGVSLFLMGQYFNQVSNDLKNAILTNTINYYIFRVSQSDAQDFTSNIELKLNNSSFVEDKINMFTKLNNRELIVRISKNGIILPAFKGVTEDFISCPGIRKKEVKREIIGDNKEKANMKFTYNNASNLKNVLEKSSTYREGE